MDQSRYGNIAVLAETETIWDMVSRAAMMYLRSGASRVVDARRGRG